MVQAEIEQDGHSFKGLKLKLLFILCRSLHNNGPLKFDRAGTYFVQASQGLNVLLSRIHVEKVPLNQFSAQQAYIIGRI